MSALASQEYQILSSKMDKLIEKVDNGFTRVEDSKVSRPEYVRAHEALVLRVELIEHKMDSEIHTADATHEKIEMGFSTRYDKINDSMAALSTKYDTKFEALNVKIDSLKDIMNSRFDAMRERSRATWQWAIGLLVGAGGGGLIGTLIWFYLHTAGH